MTHPRHTIIPPYLLRHLAETADAPVATRAEQTLRADQGFRAERTVVRPPAPPYGRARSSRQPLDRVISTAKNTERLPGSVVRSEGEGATGDQAADEAYEGFGATWRLFHDVYGRDSIDGAGLQLAGTVHYGKGYDNAFWNGERMVFGDGDGEIFGRFTASLEVIGHELTHGVTERSAGLVYRGQPGALNEHISDVFGVLVKQHQLGQNADAADWLVGADLLLPGVKGVAIRSMIAPGTAYDDPRLGKDPQPDHMDRFVVTTDDNGGVHINSGIPNRAFALAAKAVGGPAWMSVGQVWFDVLTGGQLPAKADFAAFARLTIAAAAARFGAGSGAVHNAVQRRLDVGRCRDRRTHQRRRLKRLQRRDSLGGRVAAAPHGRGHRRRKRAAHQPARTAAQRRQTLEQAAQLRATPGARRQRSGARRFLLPGRL